MRGENNVPLYQPMRVTGSPPHARGKRGKALFIVQHGGITPACAGKTRLAVAIALSHQDHPRMRGENPTTFRLRSAR